MTPFTVWQLLQSPEVTEPTMARVLVPSTTAALRGGRGRTRPRVWKFPDSFTVSSNTLLRESVMTTVLAGGGADPMQSSAS